MYKANSYAKRLGAIGGRLLTYEEANSLKDSYKDIIIVQYAYWLASAHNISYVNYVSPRSVSDSNAAIYNYGTGVRPVIEISKSAI